MQNYCFSVRAKLLVSWELARWPQCRDSPDCPPSPPPPRRAGGWARPRTWPRSWWRPPRGSSRTAGTAPGCRGCSRTSRIPDSPRDHAQVLVTSETSKSVTKRRLLQSVQKKCDPCLHGHTSWNPSEMEKVGVFWKIQVKCCRIGIKPFKIGGKMA